MHPSYWKRYVIEADACEVERKLERLTVAADDGPFELVHFRQGKQAPCVLISPGSGGHAYVFAELGYRMHGEGFNVFIMPKHGGRTIPELMARHAGALRFIGGAYNDRVGVFAEGLGGYAVFYLALAHGPLRGLVCQNSPAVLDEDRFHEAVLRGKGAARRRKVILPLAKALLKVAPGLKLPISLYLDFREMVDTKGEKGEVEAAIVRAYRRDPDFDRRYPLSAVMSLMLTPPPAPLAGLRVPTMFLLPVRGFTPGYVRDLYGRLPPIRKRLLEVDGGVFWMVSHPRDAARVICEWFGETV